MPVLGRPTKAALLNTTHGSSGPVITPFQNVRIGVGATISAAPFADEIPEFRRVHVSHPITASAATSARLKPGTRYRLCAADDALSTRSFAQLAAALPLPCTAAAAALS